MGDILLLLAVGVALVALTHMLVLPRRRRAQRYQLRRAIEQVRVRLEG